LRPAHDRSDPVELHDYARLLNGLAQGSLVWGFIRLHRSADRLPEPRLTLANQQQPPVLVPGQHSNGGYEEELVANPLAQTLQIR
jgi:hypothetical protein